MAKIEEEMAGYAENCGKRGSDMAYPFSWWVV